ncbi:endoribonuclease [Lithospermum erythrorhizon]|uniref:Endoribonuclease n=1 Tax=Lithospermum erythrorhizon TaxID=34254 RepID=A0AAV3R0A8_LITER
MEGDNWVCSSDEENGSEGCFDDPNDDEDCFVEGGMPKLQSRYVVSKAQWSDELGMAEVVEKKGKVWMTTGITRNGKLFCTLEETLYLIEIGALQVSDGDHAPLTRSDIYKKASEAGSYNFKWDSFVVYRHLKFLGYIVACHGVPWTMKTINVDPTNMHGTPPIENNLNDDPGDNLLVTKMFDNLEIKGMQPIFDVYSPNSKFKKSAPGNPCFMLYLSGGHPPSVKEISNLENYCAGTPSKICKVEDGCVSFFSWRKVELPILP